MLLVSVQDLSDGCLSAGSVEVIAVPRRVCIEANWQRFRAWRLHEFADEVCWDVRKTKINGEIMKLLRPALLAGAIAAVLSGCTYADPTLDAGSPVTDPPSPSFHPSPSFLPVSLEGEFQSQAAVTSGSATIRVTVTGAVLQLNDFSTEPGADLRLMLSPGILSPDATGDLGLTSSHLIDLGPLSDAAGQRIDMDTKMWSSMPEPVRSVVIYNYADRTAHGTANLSQITIEN